MVINPWRSVKRLRRMIAHQAEIIDLQAKTYRELKERHREVCREVAVYRARKEQQC